MQQHTTTAATTKSRLRRPSTHTLLGTLCLLAVLLVGAAVASAASEVRSDGVVPPPADTSAVPPAPGTGIDAPPAPPTLPPGTGTDVD
jgi:hypothetical protein